LTVPKTGSWKSPFKKFNMLRTWLDIIASAFSFLCENNRFGQGSYFNLQAEKATDFKSISNNDMKSQSVNNENS
jgi:hypothetical protein